MGFIRFYSIMKRELITLGKEMNMSRKMPSLFKMSFLTLGALSLFSIPAMAADYTSWRLTEIKKEFSDKRGIVSGLIHIDEVYADARGGYVWLTEKSENAAPECRGAVQRFNYVWTFDRDISLISGKKGDRVFNVNLYIKGDKGGKCIEENPFFTVWIGASEVILPDIRGEVRWYFKEVPGYIKNPPPPNFYFNRMDNPKAGFKIAIHLRRAGVEGGLMYFIEYLYTAGSAVPPDNKAAFCDQYAKTAISKNEENKRRNCGYTGARWQSHYNNHYGWCMGVDKSWADAETRGRDDELRQCGRKSTSEFRNPTVRGYRIDRCLYWGRECDKPAADRFCRDQGFPEAEAWQWEYTAPTLILGDGKICNASGCGGFSYIRCVEIRR
jgi:hypothetical protein